MWVKICGNTRREDVLDAHRLGADAVGFIFAHGRRLVTAEHVRTLIGGLPDSLQTFGVFTQTDADFILRTAEAAGITGVQVHGDFRPELLRALRPHIQRLVQVVPWWTDGTSEAQAPEFRATVDAIASSGWTDAMLIDSRTETASGGTGIALDWAAAARALEGVDVPVILAGGLRPETVAEAIATIRPWGVDVSSGVEAAPGVKSSERLATFLKAAKQ